MVGGRILRAAVATALVGLGGMAAAPLAQAQAIEGFTDVGSGPAAYPIPAFYNVPDKVVGRAPGDVLRKERVAAPAGAQAWRVIYVSRTWDDRMVPVSGLIIAPLGRPAAPRPLLSWAHGTTGAARGCAPSLVPDPARTFTERGGAGGASIDYGVPYLEDLIARGYVVTATDDYGLGGPGRHQFLVGETAARNTLDIARAAQHIAAAGAGTDVSLLGWSQGGQAVLFAGEIADRYAPDLKVRAVAAFAPAATIMSPVVDTLFRSNIPQVYLIASGFTAAYGLPLDAFTARGRALTEASGKTCVLDVFRQTALSKAPGVSADITGVKGWTEALTRNQAGLQASSAPVLVLHGTADKVVAPASTPAYEARAKAVGADVTVSWIEGGDHRSSLRTGKTQVLAWLDAHRAGAAAPPPASVRIGYLKLANGQLISKAMGWHEAALGAPVRWIGFETGGQVNKAIAAGEIDFGALGNPPAAAGVSQGIPYQGVIALNMLEGVEALAVKSTLGIASPKDLAGKRVGVALGSSSYYVLLSLLQAEGVPQAQVTLVDLTPDKLLAAWTAGRIDAAWVWEPSLDGLVQAGGKVLLTNADMAGRGWRTWDIGVVTTAFAAAHPETVARYVRTECAAIDLWRAKPDEAVVIVARELAVPITDARRMMAGTGLISCTEQTGRAYLGATQAPGAFGADLYAVARMLKANGRLAQIAEPGAYQAFIQPRFVQAASNTGRP